MRSSLILVLNLLISFEGIVFGATLKFTGHGRVKRNKHGLQFVEKAAQTGIRHSPTTPSTGEVTLPTPTSFVGSGRRRNPSRPKEDNCSWCGQQLNSLTQFCSEERELYGFPLSIFNHSRSGRYEVNILTNGDRDERVGQVVFPQYFKERLVKCRCWNVAVSHERPVNKWPVRLTFGFPPDSKENLVTSISRLMKKADSLVCPTDKSKTRARFYLAEAEALQREFPRDHRFKVVKLVKAGRKVETAKPSSVSKGVQKKSQSIVASVSKKVTSSRRVGTQQIEKKSHGVASVSKKATQSSHGHSHKKL